MSDFNEELQKFREEIKNNLIMKEGDKSNEKAITGCVVACIAFVLIFILGIFSSIYDAWVVHKVIEWFFVIHLSIKICFGFSLLLGIIIGTFKLAELSLKKKVEEKEEKTLVETISFGLGLIIGKAIGMSIILGIAFLMGKILNLMGF